MALQTINTIQNINDLKNIVDQYQLESLANLGQRFSIKGDGVSSRTFTLNELLYENTNKNKVAKMYINDSKLFICPLLNETLDLDLFNKIEIEYSLDNAVYSDAPIALNTSINGIDFYRENMLMFKSTTNNYFYIASLGCDNSKIIYELNIEKYDILTNKVVESIKLIDLNESEKNEFSNVNQYSENVGHFYLYYINGESKNISEFYINSSLITSIYVDFQTFALSLYNSLIVDYYKVNKTLNLESIVAELKNIGFLQTENFEISIFTNVEDTNIQGYSVNIENTQLNTILNYIYNQETEMYPFIYSYYCNFVYRKDNKQFKKILLYNLFERAFNDSKNQNEIIENFELFIPLNYVFDFYVNDNDEYFIYSNITPVSIFYTNELLNINSDFIQLFYDISDKTNNETNNLILAHSNKFETCILYRFSIQYNEQSKKDINNILVSKMYSTPYIQDNYWVINNFKSVYRGVGKDAGNPNMMMMYYAASNSSEIPSILSSTNDYISDNLFEWGNSSEVSVKLFEQDFIDFYASKINIKLKTNYNLAIKLPVNVNIELSEKLKNTFIYYLIELNEKTLKSDTEHLNEIKRILGEKPVITIFVQFDANGHYFKIVSNNDEILTLNSLTNANNIQYNLFSTLSKTDEIDENYHKGFIAIEKTDIEKNQFGLLANERLCYTTINYSQPRSYLLDKEKYLNKNILNIYSYYKSENSKISESNRKVQNIGNSNEFIPANNIPTLNLNEFLTSDIQLQNRANFVTFDKDSKIYYSYIGSSIDDVNKNVLHIGSSTSNKHIGTSYLFDENFNGNFIVQDTLSIDFNKYRINAKHNFINSINHHKILERKNTSGVVTYFYTFDTKFNFSATDTKILNNKYFYKEIDANNIPIFNFYDDVFDIDSKICTILTSETTNFSINTKINYVLIDTNYLVSYLFDDINIRINNVKFYDFSRDNKNVLNVESSDGSKSVQYLCSPVKTFITDNTEFNKLAYLNVSGEYQMTETNGNLNIASLTIRIENDDKAYFKWK